MALETVSSVKDLDPLNPVETDPVGEGNEHLQNIKKALLQDSLRFITLAEAVGSSKYLEGARVQIDEKIAGEDATEWDVVLTSGVTPNGDDIRQSTGDPLLSLVLDKHAQTGVNTAAIAANVTEIANAKLNDDIRNDQIGTTYTVQPSDRGKSVSMDNAAANVITIDTNANQACVVDMVAMLRQKGAGLTTVTAVAGVTLNGVDGGSVPLDGQWRSATINQYATDAWWIEGMSGTVA